MSEPRTAIEYERTDERLPRIGRRVRQLVGWAAVALATGRFATEGGAMLLHGRFGLKTDLSNAAYALPLSALLLVGGILILARARIGLRCVQAWAVIEVLLTLVGTANMALNVALAATPGTVVILLGTLSVLVLPALLLGLTLSPLREAMFPADGHI
jgi:hypothetical protein